MHSGNFRENFLAIYDNKIQHKLSLKKFCGIESRKCFRRAFPASRKKHERQIFVCREVLHRNPYVPKMLMVIVFLSFNKESFIKY